MLGSSFLLESEMKTKNLRFYRLALSPKVFLLFIEISPCSNAKTLAFSHISLFSRLSKRGGHREFVLVREFPSLPSEGNSSKTTPPPPPVPPSLAESPFRTRVSFFVRNSPFSLLIRSTRACSPRLFFVVRPNEPQGFTPRFRGLDFV